MADNEIKPSTDGGREELVAKQLASTKIHLALTQERVDVSSAIKLPLERIPQLGVALASLPSTSRTVTNTVSVPTLLQATDKYGNPLDLSKLNSFKDGSGLTGGYRWRGPSPRSLRLSLPDTLAVIVATEPEEVYGFI